MLDMAYIYRLQRMTSQVVFNDLELLCAYDRISLVLLLSLEPLCGLVVDQLHKVSP